MTYARNPRKTRVGASGLIKAAAAVLGSVLLANTALPQELELLSVENSTLIGGYTTRGNIHLVAPAGVGGALIDLSSNNPVKAAVPDSVLIHEGTRNHAFNVVTQTVLEDTWVTITASTGGHGLTVDVLLTTGGLTDVECDPVLCAGAIGEGEAWLSGPQATDVAVDLLSFDPLVASVPATAVVPAGQRFGGFFDIQAGMVAVSSTATIRAKLVNSIRLCTVTVHPGAASLTIEVRKNNGALQNNAGVTVVFADGTTLTGTTKNGYVSFGPPLPLGNANVFIRMPGAGVLSGPYPVTIQTCDRAFLALKLSNA